MAVVTFFGSRYPREGSPEYEVARTLGCLLARQGHTICTGGYSGIMEAASRGAREAGGHTIGITVKTFRGAANPYVVEELPSINLFARLEKLISLGEAYVVCRGGMGTIAELCLVWNLVQMGQVNSRRPIFLLGEFWNQFLDDWKRSTDIDAKDYSLLRVARTPEEITEQLNTMVR